MRCIARRGVQAFHPRGWSLICPHYQTSPGLHLEENRAMSWWRGRADDDDALDGDDGGEVDDGDDDDSDADGESG